MAIQVLFSGDQHSLMRLRFPGSPGHFIAPSITWLAGDIVIGSTLRSRLVFLPENFDIADGEVTQAQLPRGVCTNCRFSWCISKFWWFDYDSGGQYQA